MDDAVPTQAEVNAEIVATCEAAVSWLTDESRGWTQGSFADHEDYRAEGTDYTRAQACLGGAIVLSELLNDEAVRLDRVPLFPDWDATLDGCPAVHAVADVIREEYPGMLTDAHYEGGETSAERDKNLIFAFNDHDDRTVEQVVDVLNETIKRHIN